MSAKIYRLDDCALADLDGILISTLAEAYMKRGYSAEQAIDQALGDVLIDLSRRTEAARAS